MLFVRAGSITIGTRRIALDKAGPAARFEIDKRHDGHPNTAKLEIFNLQPSTRGELSAAAAKHKTAAVPVLVSAGYAQQTVAQIFAGDLRFLWHSRDGADVKTTIEAGTGEFSLGRAKTFRSWGPG